MISTTKNISNDIKTENDILFQPLKKRLLQSEHIFLQQLIYPEIYSYSLPFFETKVQLWLIIHLFVTEFCAFFNVFEMLL